MTDPARATALTGIGPIFPGVTTRAELAAWLDGGPRQVPADGEWFASERLLGSKGVKYLTPASRYLLAASRHALDDAGLGDGMGYEPRERGIVIGTNFSAWATLERLDRSVLSAGTSAVQPLDAPNFSIHMPASRVAIRHDLQAFNLSLSGPMVAGVEAVWMGATAIAQGRARLVIAGATEERAPRLLGATLGVAPAPGGACALVLEALEPALARGARPYACIGGGALLFDGCGTKAGEGGDLAQRVAHALDRLLEGHDGALGYACLSSPFAFNRRADVLVRAHLARRGIALRAHAGPGADGSFVTVSPLLQLAGLGLAHAAGLVMATSPHGHLALVMLQGAPPARGASGGERP